MKTTRNVSGRVTHIVHGFRYVAFCQAAVSIMLLFLVWLNAFLDLPTLWFGGTPRTPDILRGLLASAAVLTASTISIAYTYLQTKRIVSRLVPLCCFCQKVFADGSWIGMDAYRKTHPVSDFTHAVCPECYARQVERLSQNDSTMPPPG